MTRKKCCARLVLLLAAVLGFSGCATTQQYDYSQYRSNPPRSLLVLPPANETVEVLAPYVYLSTISRPLGEAGYYVFPVAVVDAFMKENGLTAPEDMHSAPLDKIREIIGADAVLYTTLEDWGQKYQVLSSNTVVKARSKLVDVDTGVTLWEGTAQAAEGSGDGGAGIVGALILAVVDQILDSITDKTHSVAVAANQAMVNNPNTGLPLGPYNPDYVTDPRRQ